MSEELLIGMEPTSEQQEKVKELSVDKGIDPDAMEVEGQSMISSSFACWNCRAVNSWNKNRGNLSLNQSNTGMKQLFRTCFKCGSVNFLK